jgi:U2 small nuclear ribonucleoprotein A'
VLRNNRHGRAGNEVAWWLTSSCYCDDGNQPVLNTVTVAVLLKSLDIALACLRYDDGQQPDVTTGRQANLFAESDRSAYHDTTVTLIRPPHIHCIQDNTLSSQQRMRLSAELLNSAEQRPNALGERELVLRGRGIPLIEHLGATRDAYDCLDLTDNRLTRLDNFPRLQRLSSLQLAGNWIESFDVENLSKNLPSVTMITLSYNRLSQLHQVDNVGKAFPKLEFLSLVGNPVTRKLSFVITFAFTVCWKKIIR